MDPAPLPHPSTQTCVFRHLGLKLGKISMTTKVHECIARREKNQKIALKCDRRGNANVLPGFSLSPSFWSFSSSSFAYFPFFYASSMSFFRPSCISSVPLSVIFNTMCCLIDTLLHPATLSFWLCLLPCLPPHFLLLLLVLFLPNDSFFLHFVLSVVFSLPLIIFSSSYPSPFFFNHTS